jgi:hypothetical protein
MMQGGLALYSIVGHMEFMVREEWPDLIGY